MNLDTLVKLVQDKEVETSSQFYDYLVKVDEFKNKSLPVSDMRQNISAMFVDENVVDSDNGMIQYAWFKKAWKKIKNIITILPIIDIPIVVNGITKNAKSGKYNNDINVLFTTLDSMIDNPMIIKHKDNIAKLLKKLETLLPDFINDIKAREEKISA